MLRLLWVQNLLCEFYISQSSHMTIYCDNITVTYLCAACELSPQVHPCGACTYEIP